MPGPRSFDPISIAERSYSLQGTEREWIDRLVEAVAPAIDDGIVVYGFTYRWHGRDPYPAEFASGEPAWENLVRAIAVDYITATVGTPKPCNTFSQQVAELPLHMQGLDDRFFRPNGFADVFGVHAVDPDGGVFLVSGLAEKRTVSARDTARWRRVTVHMGTALRLRRRFEREAAERDEAVLSPSGRLLHATGRAKQADARDRLRAAARAIDRARGPLRRSDPQEAIELWRALCDGRWSLVDRFESDGRRYLIAHPNEPHLPDLRGLSQREASVAAFVQLGQANKEIAYALGISLSSVATYLSSALRKLGLSSRAALAATSFGQRVEKAGDHFRAG